MYVFDKWFVILFIKQNCSWTTPAKKKELYQVSEHTIDVHFVGMQVHSCYYFYSFKVQNFIDADRYLSPNMNKYRSEVRYTRELPFVTFTWFDMYQRNIYYTKALPSSEVILEPPQCTRCTFLSDQYTGG